MLVRHDFKVWAILDTGAVFNIISERIYRDLCLKEKLKLQPCNLELILGDGKTIRALGKVNLKVRTDYPDSRGCLSFREEFVVLKMESGTPCQVFIGYRTISEKDLFLFMKKPNIPSDSVISDIECEDWLWEPKERLPEEESTLLMGFTVPKSRADEFKEILEYFTKPYEGVRKSIPPLVIRLQSGKEFKTKTFRRIPRARKEFLEEEIKSLLAEKIIIKSKSPVFSPIVIVPKKGNKLRLCIDFRDLNNITVPYPHPLPRLDDCLEDLGGMTLFGTLDLSKGFHQVPLDHETAHLTAFRTPAGLFQYIMMSFGLVNAPAHFQFVMNKIFDGLMGKACIVYIDDVSFLGEILTTSLKIYHWFSTEPKNTFSTGFETVEFLGFLLSKKGRVISPARTKAILEMARPSNKTDVWSFLGLLNFIRDFVPDCSGLCYKLYKLTEKDKRFEWSKELEEDFLRIKSIIKNAVPLAYPDDSQELHIFTDASDYGIGGILVQTVPGGTFSPLAFVSKILNSTQLRWSTFEKEAWAIVFAISKLDYFLRGRHFHLHTDHRNLTFLKSSPNAKVGRWFLTISEYSFDIHHIAGARNGAADCLSRLPINRGPFAAIQICKLKDGGIFKELKELLSKFPPSGEYTTNSDGLMMVDETSLYIPETPDFRKKLFTWAHSSLIGGHKGINSTLKFLVLSESFKTNSDYVNLLLALFESAYEQYRARHGTADMYTLIDLDILSIYEDVCHVKLPNPEDMTPEEVRASESTFVEAVSSFFGKLSGLDALYRFEKLKKLVDSFRTRVEAALDRIENPDLSTLTETIFTQQSIVSEGIEDFQRYVPSKRYALVARDEVSRNLMKPKPMTPCHHNRDRNMSKVKCFKCKGFEHYKRDCPGTTHSFKALQVSDHDRPILPVKILDSQGNDVQSTKTLLDSGESISFASKTFIETLKEILLPTNRWSEIRVMGQATVSADLQAFKSSRVWLPRTWNMLETKEHWLKASTSGLVLDPDKVIFLESSPSVELFKLFPLDCMLPLPTCVM
ncbi:Retrovirus-related Pol polyprotein from transposon 297 [Aduncisulcus paluster]|uniref:RNA-directed DNA polymerase n=1 Tax=Aduncisulcus paluster TaxID=2918883 RepID=A0ABQ5KT37_9EUKA|nr:Retrovirus-related Pol polyprotein from transposon 297 [Aduncisulcus paluster]